MNLMQVILKIGKVNNILQEPNYIWEISQSLWLKNTQVEIVLELIFEWATVPFIARYRKEKTLWLDENHIRDIIDLRQKIENIFKAKTTAINTIEELGAMTPELMNNILKAKTLKEVEEIYKPYKSKKKTKAMLAVEKWFQPIADIIKTNRDISVGIDWIDPNISVGIDCNRSLQDRNACLRSLQEKYTFEEIIEWAQHIISAEISANADLRADLIETLKEHGNIISKLKWEKMLAKLNEKDQSQIQKFEIYKDFSLRLKYLKPYQILALNRWEKLWILWVKIEKTERTFDWIMMHYARLLTIRTPFTKILSEAFTDWYTTLFKSVENEVRGMLCEEWEDDAIETFRSNLGQLLMTKPEYWNIILAIDPWFHAGCKIAVLDTGGNPISFNKIFLRSSDQAIKILEKILWDYAINKIIIWNGTWVNETTELLYKIVGNAGMRSDLGTVSNRSLQDNIFIVNESGASVYSASKVAQEEFPDLDSLDRWTVSIWRRYIDPLSELVKIPVWSIGVGMYQHDISEKKLEEKLGFVIEDTVNEVGINVNTASSYVLNHISGINKTAAKKIYNHRPYSSRAQLKKQLSAKVYEQAIWFLRVPESTETLDNTDIHPEQYGLAKYITWTHNSLLNSLPFQGKEATDFVSKYSVELTELYPDTTVDTISFILQSLESAGVEKRVNSTHKKATIRGAVDHKEWDIVEWVVRNVVAFGAFVDIGMKNDGLVHVSQIADRFISDPKEEVEVGQTVRVKITGIDEKNGKVQLSMKEV